MPFSSFSAARRSSTSKLRAFRFSAPNTVMGLGISRPSPASEMIYCASLRELNWYTFFTSSRSAVGMGSPVMASTSRTPSAYSPSSSALVAFRLRSRQVMWGSTFSPNSRCTRQATSEESIRARAMGQSATVSRSAPAACNRRAPSR